jgi:hypothetical protein
VCCATVSCLVELAARSHLRQISDFALITHQTVRDRTSPSRYFSSISCLESYKTDGFIPKESVSDVRKGTPGNLAPPAATDARGTWPAP